MTDKQKSSVPQAEVICVKVPDEPGKLDHYEWRKREHEASPDCWCNPRVEYVDPITGDAVYVHHKPN